jgi:lysophospholipase L1-like esterase
MLTFTNAATNIVFDGNSLFANPMDVNGVYSDNNRIGEKMLALAPINGAMTYKNIARGGATFKSMVTGPSDIAEVTASFESGKQNLLFVLEGVNTALTARPDGSVCTAADIIQDCKDYLAAVKAGHQDWRIYIVLATPYKDDTEPSVGNAAIDGYNAYIRANYASMGIEGYVETRRPGGVLPYQPPYTYGTFFPGGGYYADIVHLSAKGNDVIAGYMAETLMTIPDVAPASTGGGTTTTVAVASGNILLGWL